MGQIGRVVVNICSSVEIRCHFNWPRILILRAFRFTTKRTTSAESKQSCHFGNCYGNAVCGVKSIAVNHSCHPISKCKCAHMCYEMRRVNARERRERE